MSAGASPRSSRDLTLTIRHFEPGDEEAFRRLNEEWITAFFRLEAKDEEMFADPERVVLNKGGHIFLAERQSDEGGLAVIGCCALLPMGSAEFEVSKMAVSPSLRGGGVGRAVLRHAIDFARARGVRRLYIETNHILSNAIHLYESLGFEHLPAHRVVPSPYARADIFMELLLH